VLITGVVAELGKEPAKLGVGRGEVDDEPSGELEGGCCPLDELAIDVTTNTHKSFLGKELQVDLLVPSDQVCKELVLVSLRVKYTKEPVAVHDGHDCSHR